MRYPNPINQNQLSLDIPILYPSEHEIQLISEILHDKTCANPDLQQLLELGEYLMKSHL